MHILILALTIAGTPLWTSCMKRGPSSEEQEVQALKKQKIASEELLPETLTQRTTLLQSLWQNQESFFSMLPPELYPELKNIFLINTSTLQKLLNEAEERYPIDAEDFPLHFKELPKDQAEFLKVVPQLREEEERLAVIMLLRKEYVYDYLRNYIGGTSLTKREKLSLINYIYKLLRQEIKRQLTSAQPNTFDMKWLQSMKPTIDTFILMLATPEAYILGKCLLSEKTETCTTLLDPFLTKSEKEFSKKDWKNIISTSFTQVMEHIAYFSNTQAIIRKLRFIKALLGSLNNILDLSHFGKDYTLLTLGAYFHPVLVQELVNLGIDINEVTDDSDYGNITVLDKINNLLAEEELSFTESKALEETRTILLKAGAKTYEELSKEEKDKYSIDL